MASDGFPVRWAAGIRPCQAPKSCTRSLNFPHGRCKSCIKAWPENGVECSPTCLQIKSSPFRVSKRGSLCKVFKDGLSVNFNFFYHNAIFYVRCTQFSVPRTRLIWRKAGIEECRDARLDFLQTVRWKSSAFCIRWRVESKKLNESQRILSFSPKTALLDTKNHWSYANLHLGVQIW